MKTLLITAIVLMSFAAMGQTQDAKMDSLLLDAWQWWMKHEPKDEPCPHIYVHIAEPYIRGDSIRYIKKDSIEQYRQYIKIKPEHPCICVRCFIEAKCY